MQESNLLMYTTEDGLTKIEATFVNDTVWLSIEQMAELFQRDKSTISRHIKNIFAEGELNRGAVVAKFATTTLDGKTYQVDYYRRRYKIRFELPRKTRQFRNSRVIGTGIGEMMFP